RVAEHFPEAPVRGANSTIDLDKGESDRGGLERPAKALLTLAECCLGLEVPRAPALEMLGHSARRLPGEVVRPYYTTAAPVLFVRRMGSPRPGSVRMTGPGAGADRP